MLKSIAQGAAPYLLFGVYKSLVASWRIKIFETPHVENLVQNHKSFIVAHWHGDELGILHLLRQYHVACMISTSKDGDLMNKAVQLLGAETVRGSSTRGGAQALKGIVRLTKKGRRPSMAVDGPKGPLYQVKAGVFQIAKLTKLPVIPISFYSSRTHIFEKSWNKARLPLPLSRVTVCWGEALTIGAEDDPKDPAFASRLAENLFAARERAEEMSKTW